jgi:hypothetical protein
LSLINRGPDLLSPQTFGRAPSERPQMSQPLGSFCLPHSQRQQHDRRGISKAEVRRPRFLAGRLEKPGQVRGMPWIGVTIDWDDGESTSVSHNDMAQVSRAPS